MAELERLKDLFRHMEWADARVWTSVLGAPAAAENANMGERLLHIHAVQTSFLRHWQDRFEGFGKPDLDGVESLLAWGREFYGQAHAYLTSLGEGDLGQPSIVPWAALVERRIGQPARPSSLAETLYQVVMHSTYHRGQVNTRLRELGVEPPQTDYIGWVWLGRPDPAWPDRTSR